MSPDAEKFRLEVETKLLESGWAHEIAAAVAANAARFYARPPGPRNDVALVQPLDGAFRNLATDICFQKSWQQNGFLRTDMTCFLRNPRNPGPGAVAVADKTNMPPIGSLRVASVETLDITDDWLVVRFLAGRPADPARQKETGAPSTPTTTVPSRQLARLSQAPEPERPLPAPIVEAQAYLTRHLSPLFRFLEKYKEAWESGKNYKVLEKVAQESIGFKGWDVVPDGGRLKYFVVEGAGVWKRWLNEVYTDAVNASSRLPTFKSASDSSKNGENNGGSSQ